MVLSQCAWRNNVAVGAGLPRINVHNANDARGSCFDCDPSGLVKFVRNYVLIIGQSDDDLDDQFS